MAGQTPALHSPRKGEDAQELRDVVWGEGVLRRFSWEWEREPVEQGRHPQAPGILPQLSPSPKDKGPGLLSDRNLGWESGGCCGFNNLWEKLLGEFLPR